MRQLWNDIRAAFEAARYTWHNRRYRAKHRAQIKLPF